MYKHNDLLHVDHLIIYDNVNHKFITHTKDYGTSAIYTNDISVLKNTTISLVV